MWPDQRIQDLFGIELPIIQAPMAGANGSEMVIAVSEAGGLGSLPRAMLSLEQMRNELGIIRQRTSRPINLNFSATRRHKPTRCGRLPGSSVCKATTSHSDLIHKRLFPLRLALLSTAPRVTLLRSSHRRSSVSTSAYPSELCRNGSGRPA
jgi:NAD(P)H-dependent flavin oxidoreductase YrpB (nitropropane dioxygenase family)